jgi:hypothetical protein
MCLEQEMLGIESRDLRKESNYIEGQMFGVFPGP